jgi:hypothetical protein
MTDRDVRVIEIEDVSDCLACERRDHEYFALMAEVRIVCLGSAWCQECGREFKVMAEAVTGADW